MSDLWSVEICTVVMQNGEAYRALYHRALEAKCTQCPEAGAAHIASGDARFSHHFPSGNGYNVDEFEATSMCQSLYEIREAMKRRSILPETG